MNRDIFSIQEKRKWTSVKPYNTNVVRGKHYQKIYHGIEYIQIWRKIKLYNFNKYTTQLELISILFVKTPLFSINTTSL